MTDNLLTMNDNGEGGQAMPPSPSSVPLNVPAKFWDAEKQEIRVEALLKSYVELEKKLSTMVDAGKLDNGKINEMRGVPSSAEGYTINLEQSLLDNDPDVNARMHEAGFTSNQVQLVYDLASEKMLPLIVELAAEFQADKEVERLKREFGGPDKWSEVSRQLLAFGQKNLPADVLGGLASSYEGVMALHSMMKSNKTLSFGNGGEDAPAVDEFEIKKMMQSPQYWRDKDPTVIAKVTEGFKKLYQ